MITERQEKDWEGLIADAFTQLEKDGHLTDPATVSIVALIHKVYKLEEQINKLTEERK